MGSANRETNLSHSPPHVDRELDANGSGATAFRPCRPRRASPVGCHIERYLLRTPWNSEDERLVASTFRRGRLSQLPAWYPQAGARLGVPDRVAVPCVGMGLALAPAHPLAMLLFPNGVCVAASIGAIPRKWSLAGSGGSHSEKGVVVWKGRNGVEDGVRTLGRSRGPSWRGVTTIGQWL